MTGRSDPSSSRNRATVGELVGRTPPSGRATVATDLLRNEFLLFGAPIGDAAIVDIVDDVYLPLVRRPMEDR